MEIYSIGFTKKTAERFFDLLKRNSIRRLIDVRLNNISQLAGFAKRDDLSFFLRELCGAEYIHDTRLAPTQGMLDDYKKRKGSWQEYERNFLKLMSERSIENTLDPGFFSAPTVLLCSELRADFCHRRLVLEYLAAKWGNVTAKHL